MPPLNSNFREQLEALKRFYEAALSTLPTGTWSWGGGTVLALFHYNHRLSFDIDLFVKDEQLVSLLSPKWYIDEVNFFENEYTDLPTHIQLLTRKNHIKIDVLVSSLFYPTQTQQIDVLPFAFEVETPKEIIAKKIKFRKEQNLARDIFDIAVALEFSPTLLNEIRDETVGVLDPASLRVWLDYLSRLDIGFYKNEMDKIQPAERFVRLALDAPKIIKEQVSRLL